MTRALRGDSLRELHSRHASPFRVAKALWYRSPSSRFVPCLREKSRAPAVRHGFGRCASTSSHGFERAAEAPALRSHRGVPRRRHSRPLWPSRVPNRSACRQRAIAICDLNFGPFPRPIGPESGTDFGARFRHSNRTAAAQV